MKFLSLHINSANYDFLMETLKYEKKKKKKKKKKGLLQTVVVCTYIIKIAYRNIQVNMLHVSFSGMMSISHQQHYKQQILIFQELLTATWKMFRFQ